jgi:HAD superfamily hydrolase (TIGR01509 family)
MPVETVAAQREVYFRELLPQLQAVPEVMEHIEDQYGKIPFAVVSGSTRDSVLSLLNRLHLADRFETMVCAGDYKKSKPHPEGLLMAAERLGVPPEHCLVFEDTALGIQAATAAGMTSVLVPMPSERR